MEVGCLPWSHILELFWKAESMNSPWSVCELVACIIYDLLVALALWLLGKYFHFQTYTNWPPFWVFIFHSLTSNSVEQSKKTCRQHFTAKLLKMPKLKEPKDKIIACFSKSVSDFSLFFPLYCFGCVAVGKHSIMALPLNSRGAPPLYNLHKDREMQVPLVTSWYWCASNEHLGKQTKPPFPLWGNVKTLNLFQHYRSKLQPLACMF